MSARTDLITWLSQYDNVNMQVALSLIDTIVADDVTEVEGQGTASAAAIVTVTPDEGEVFTSFKIAKVTAAIDENIVAANIKSGVTILGVEGTYTGA